MSSQHKRWYRPNKSHQAPKPPPVLGQWTLTKPLGRGGNGAVWRATSNAGTTGAVKILTKVTPTAYQRFRDEVQVLLENRGLRGVLPIWDHFLPAKPSGQQPWYAMPEATPLEKELTNVPSAHIVLAFSQLADCLVVLHKKGIAHRDIKPSNLFMLNGAPCFGDFGLVEYPGKKEVTGEKEPVGPKWTMAPEMRRYGGKANAVKGDIYSLAKTLWIMLTREWRGFDGRYSASGPNSLSARCPALYADPLDRLLLACTDDDPTKRPPASEIAKLLTQWLVLNDNYQKRNPVQWIEIQQKLFPDNMPLRAEWQDLRKIASVLNLIGSKRDLNHTFLPNQGGLDILSAKLSAEEGCLELSFNVGLCIVRPSRLLFESFGDDPQWNYFRLETQPLEESGIYPNISERHMGEEVVRLKDGTCVDFDRNSNPFPRGARPVFRYFRDSFVIFQKTSIYNKASDTYDARHNSMTADEFRAYIERSIAANVGTGTSAPGGGT